MSTIRLAVAAIVDAHRRLDWIHWLPLASARPCGDSRALEVACDAGTVHKGREGVRRVGVALIDVADGFFPWRVIRLSLNTTPDSSLLYQTPVLVRPINLQLSDLLAALYVCN